MNSKLVDKIIVANETKRVKAYINSGCRKLNESIQSLTNCKYCTLFFIGVGRLIPLLGYVSRLNKGLVTHKYISFT